MKTNGTVLLDTETVPPPYSSSLTHTTSRLVSSTSIVQFTQLTPRCVHIITPASPHATQCTRVYCTAVVQLAPI